MDLIMINVGGARGGFVWCNLMANQNYMSKNLKSWFVHHFMTSPS